ncbi:MAG: hypothetical protein LQ339_007505 [Xanthoria mediterranea]|nr:MAG: hypothetical protein LQ339_007505 [Xanthoria mediterranea]
MVRPVEVAVETDADRIADVHMAAFGTNALLRAQFPTPDVRTQLRNCIATKAAADIRDPNIAVLVVRDQDKIFSFAKWSLPVSTSEPYMEAPWLWPEGTNFEVLGEWTEKMEEAQQKALGERPSYRLTFIGTDPQCERRGAASALIEWGLDRCRKSNVPAYLESTLMAVPLYERLGFKTMYKVSIILGRSVTYEEACCLFEG